MTDVPLDPERAKEPEPQGDPVLVAMVYDELRSLAARFLAGERAGHTLQPTALVHEAWLRVAAQRGAPQKREHFVALAATMMRRVLVDHAKARRREKRGGGRGAVAIDTQLPGEPAQAPLDLVALDEALEELERLAPLQARLVELRFFGGLEMAEVAALLGISERTLRREWVMARGWLRSALEAGDPSGGS